MVLKSKLILIVDDSGVTLHFLSELLKGKDYKVLTARNGQQAISALDNHSIDMVLLDLMMPHINGFEVLQYIKAIPANENLPVLIVSACTDKESINRAMQMGASAYFTKPLIIDELLKEIDLQFELASKIFAL